MPTSPWGDHRLGFGEPLAEELQQLRVSGGMGNIELDQLGNARCVCGAEPEYIHVVFRFWPDTHRVADPPRQGRGLSPGPIPLTVR